MQTIDGNSNETTSLDKKKIAIGGGIVAGVVLLIVLLAVFIPKGNNESVSENYNPYESTKAAYKSKGITYSDSDYNKDKEIIDKAYEQAAKENDSSNNIENSSSNEGTNNPVDYSSNNSYSFPKINIDDMSDAYKEMEKKNDEVIEKAKEEAANEYDDESKDDIKKELEQLDTQTLINNFLTQNNSSLTYVNNNFDVKTGIYTKDSYDNYVAKLATYLKTGETFSNQYTDQVPLEVGAAYMKYFTAYSNTVSMPCSYTNIASLYGGSESDFTCNEYTNWFKLQPNVTRVYSISVDSSNTATVTTDVGKFKLTFSILTTSEAVDNAQFHITDIEKTD